MRTLNFVLVFVGLTVWTIQGQNLNDYEFVVVPTQFGFTSSPDAFQVNSLTHFLFEKEGFKAYLGEESLPDNLRNRRCNGLTARVVKENAFLATKLAIELTDCKGQMIYRTPPGKSKSKQFKTAYHEAIRQAFQAISARNYQYSGKSMTETSAKANYTPSQSKPAAPEQPTMPDEPVMSSEVAQKVITEVDNTQVEQPDPIDQTPQASEIPVSYVNTAGEYELRPATGGYELYSAGKKIGEARLSSQGSYLVNSSEFSGIGYLRNNEFIIERKIKGVEELVEMRFEKKQ
ncbi:hypothetical protein [Croceiramulus getboli]|nr:hypothetical protein P8624_07350 [Flavobacteriaceae bacterium YJPT1-3]